MAMGEQHRGRPEPVLTQHLSQLDGDTHTGVDDQTLLPWSGSKDVAVGAGDKSRKSDGQHACEPNRHGS